MGENLSLELQPCGSRNDRDLDDLEQSAQKRRHLIVERRFACCKCTVKIENNELLHHPSSSEFLRVAIRLQVLTQLSQGLVILGSRSPAGSFLLRVETDIPRSLRVRAIRLLSRRHMECCCARQGRRPECKPESAALPWRRR